MNEIAAEELLQHTEFVRRVARALVADEHGAEDLVQETWVTALTRNRPDASSLRGWLAGVARNLARQRRRGATRRDAREAAAASTEHLPATDDVVARMETHRRVVSAVLELPASARRAIVLRYFDGLPAREVAARLGVPVETARTRVKRARERLRESLAEEHGSSGAYLVALAELARDGSSAALIPTAAPLAAVALVKVCLAGVLAAAGIFAWKLLVPVPEGASRVALEVGVAPEPEPGVTSRTSGVSPDPSAARQDGAEGSASTRRPLGAVEALETRASSGTFLVLGVDGRELTGQSGEFYLRPIGETKSEARLVSVQGGRFALEDVPPGTVQIERAAVGSGSGKRPVVFENAQFQYRREEPLVIRGLLLRDSTLRVVDARTGAQLDGVSILPEQGAPAESHPGPHSEASCLVRNVASPVLLPHARWVRGYWVTAEGYTWRFLKVDHETGGEREVGLLPAGRLEVHATGHDPEHAIHLRVYEQGTSRIAASCSLDCSPRRTASQGFTGLPPGEYDVRAEIGSLDQPPRVLDEARAVVPEGGTATVFLEPVDDRIAPAVRVAGKLVLPLGHEDLDVSLRVRPADGPALRSRDVKRISRESMNTADGDPRGTLTWYAERLTPGRYVVVVTPIQYGVLLDVPPTPVDDLRIEVPELYPFVVRTVDDASGESIEQASMRWTREMPPQAGIDAWLDFGPEPGGQGTVLLAPAGPVFLAASSPTHGQRLSKGHIGTGTNDFTLALPRHTPLEIVLMDGDAVVPWVHGMTCTLRGIDDPQPHPCGMSSRGRMLVTIDEHGLYEIAVGPLEGFQQPDPVVVAIDGDMAEPLVVPLHR